MEMKINAQLVKKLREERSWSQEHLASVSGLSLRTVQRIEADGSASPESRMALAAALGIDVARLGHPVQEMPAPPRRARSFSTHLAVYAAVCTLLVIVDLSRDGALTWVHWPMLGWGIGLFFHWIGHRRRLKQA